MKRPGHGHDHGHGFGSFSLGFGDDGDLHRYRDGGSFGDDGSRVEPILGRSA